MGRALEEVRGKWGRRKARRGRRALRKNPANAGLEIVSREALYWGRDGDVTPRPSHQTGLADFPHPAFQSEFARMRVSHHGAGLSVKRWVIDFRLINPRSANQAFG